MQAVVESCTPSKYSAWEGFQMEIYDQGSRQEETRTRQHRELMEKNARIVRMRHLSDQMELNMMAYDENQLRKHMDYYQGVPNVENPPYVDYSQEPPYQPGMPRHPTPQVHGPMWVLSEYAAPHYQSSYPYQPPPFEYPSHKQQQPSEQQHRFDLIHFMFVCLLVV
ncbi:hypothetical protein Hanom_Chr02g00152251 [Helianthus anomalus]